MLALNTICTSDDLKNLDKDISELMEDEEEKGLGDELQQARTAFKYLRTIALGWVNDAIRHNSP